LGFNKNFSKEVTFVLNDKKAFSHEQIWLPPVYRSQGREELGKVKEQETRPVWKGDVEMGLAR
jgi:hypothetical protein